MGVRNRANNGQALNIIKNYEELTGKEKNGLAFASGNRKEDYATYQVRYNKHGDLLGVKPYEFSDEKKAELDKPHFDIVDSMQILYGNKGSREYEGAKKRITNITNVSDKDINVARHIAHEN